MKVPALVATVLAAAACTPASEARLSPEELRNAAPYAAAIQGASVTLSFAGGRQSCTINAPAGTGALDDWSIEVRGCRDVTYVEVQYLGPPIEPPIAYAPEYQGALVVRELPPRSVRARVVVGGTAGTGWFDGRPR